MEVLLKTAGGILIGLAVLHAFFPAYFKWKEELRTISPLTRQIHYIHTFFIALIVLLNGLLYLTSTTELLTTPLGHRVSLGFFVFWTCRLILQFFGYSSSLWRGETIRNRDAFSILDAVVVFVGGIWVRRLRPYTSRISWNRDARAERPEQTAPAK